MHMCSKIKILEDFNYIYNVLLWLIIFSNNVIHTANYNMSRLEILNNGRRIFRLI